MNEQDPCKHVPNWKRAGVALAEDEKCEIGVKCENCGEDGFIYLDDPAMVRWTDVDWTAEEG